MAWSLVHYAAGLKDCENNRYIYESLNWRRPGAAARIAAAVLLLAAPLLNVAFWGAFFRRGARVAPAARKEAPRGPAAT